MEITSQYLIKLGNDFFYSQSPHAAYQPVNLFTFLCKFLLAGCRAYLPFTHYGRKMQVLPQLTYNPCIT